MLSVGWEGDALYWSSSLGSDVMVLADYALTTEVIQLLHASVMKRNFAEAKCIQYG